MEVSYEDFLDLAELDPWEALDLVLGAFAYIDEEGGGRGEDYGEGGLVACWGGDSG